GIDAVGDSIFGARALGGAGGVGRLLGPKISVRVDGTGDIRPVDGIAENREFCPAICATASCGFMAMKMNTNTGASRPLAAAVASILSMTVLFSAQIEAISSRLTACL